MPDSAKSLIFNRLPKKKQINNNSLCSFELLKSVICGSEPCSCNQEMILVVGRKCVITAIQYNSLTNQISLVSVHRLALSHVSCYCCLDKFCQ